MAEEHATQPSDQENSQSQNKERQPTIPHGDFWVNVKLWQKFSSELQVVLDHNPDRFKQLKDIAYDGAPVTLAVNILMSAFEVRCELALASENLEQIEAAQKEAKFIVSEARILAQVANIQADFLVENSNQSETKLDLHSSIAKIVKMVRPEPPANWPPQTEEEKGAVRKVDTLLSQYKSDGLGGADVSVCRQANMLTMDMYRLRGISPFGCVVSLENDKGEKSGHMVTVIAEEQQGQVSYVFVDGHNGRVDASFEVFAQTWKDVGWNITKCEASRFVENTSTTDDIKPGGSWETVNFPG